MSNFYVVSSEQKQDGSLALVGFRFELNEGGYVISIKKFNHLWDEESAETVVPSELATTPLLLGYSPQDNTHLSLKMYALSDSPEQFLLVRFNITNFSSLRHNGQVFSSGKWQVPLSNELPLYKADEHAELGESEIEQLIKLDSYLLLLRKITPNIVVTSKNIDTLSVLARTSVAVDYKNDIYTAIVQYYAQNLDARNNNGRTVLHALALTDDPVGLLSFLNDSLNKGLISETILSVLAIQDDEGNSILHDLAYNDSAGVASLLNRMLEQGMMLDVILSALTIQNKEGYTLFHKLASPENAEILKVLLDNLESKGLRAKDILATLAIKNTAGISILQYLSLYSSFSPILISLFINLPEDVSVSSEIFSVLTTQDELGKTVISKLASSKGKEVLPFLLRLKEKNGMTLEQLSVAITIQNQDGKTILHEFASAHPVEFSLLLMGIIALKRMEAKELKDLLGIQDKEGKTILHEYASAYPTDFAQLLSVIMGQSKMESKELKDVLIIQDNKGNTVLHSLHNRDSESLINFLHTKNGQDTIDCIVKDKSSEFASNKKNLLILLADSIKKTTAQNLFQSNHVQLASASISCQELRSILGNYDSFARNKGRWSLLSMNGSTTIKNLKALLAKKEKEPNATISLEEIKIATHRTQIDLTANANKSGTDYVLTQIFKKFEKQLPASTLAIQGSSTYGRSM